MDLAQPLNLIFIQFSGIRIKKDEAHCLKKTRNYCHIDKRICRKEVMLMVINTWSEK